MASHTGQVHSQDENHPQSLTLCFICINHAEYKQSQFFTHFWMEPRFLFYFFCLFKMQLFRSETLWTCVPRYVNTCITHCDEYINSNFWHSVVLEINFNIHGKWYTNSLFSIILCCIMHLFRRAWFSWHLNKQILWSQDLLLKYYYLSNALKIQFV